MVARSRPIKLLVLCTLGMLVGFAANGAESLSDRLSALEMVKLKAGANWVRGFAGGGRSALITYGWRDNGNAHGFNVYVVMLPTRPGGTDWNIVGVETQSELEPIVTDSPHTGEDVVKSVRFALGLLDGRRATLMFTATRDLNPDQGIPDPSKTEIVVYALRVNTEGVGSTQDYFAPIGNFTTSSLYCNADMALHQELSIPLPMTYSGPRTSTGC